MIWVSDLIEGEAGYGVGFWVGDNVIFFFRRKYGRE